MKENQLAYQQIRLKTKTRLKKERQGHSLDTHHQVHSFLTARLWNGNVKKATYRLL